jgi:hypothetical protein
MESIKINKYQQTKVLKEQTNMLDHEQKLKMIQFMVKSCQHGKATELKRKADAKLKQFHGDFNKMGDLHGELRKQNTTNGGCIPNPGMTSLSEVSFSTGSIIQCTLY